MITFNKPEYHPRALAMISLVAAGGPISMGDFAELLASALPPDQAKALATGQIVLDPTAKTFVGHEPQEAIKEGNLTIKIPAQVGGSYASSAKACTLVFQASETITAQEHILFVTLGAKLVTLTIDQKSIVLTMDKSEADVTISHG